MKNNKLLIGGIITIIGALIIAATGWNFKVTAEIPENYVNKTDYQCDQERMEKKLDRIYDVVLDIKTNGIKEK